MRQASIIKSRMHIMKQRNSPKLIILRGNSGSGKSTVAKRLQREMGYGTMLISQDVVRREILRVKDTSGNVSLNLIEQMVRYGWNVGYDVIVEGILSKEKYGVMLNRLITDCPATSHVYYFDIPFEETLRRHITKPNAHEFGEKEMREWWKEGDELGVKGEQQLNHTMTAEEIVEHIMKDRGEA